MIFLGIPMLFPTNSYYVPKMWVGFCVASSVSVGAAAPPGMGSGRKIKMLDPNCQISASRPPQIDGADQTIHSSGVRMSGDAPDSS